MPLSFEQAAEFAAAPDGVHGKLQAVLSLRGGWDDGKIHDALESTVSRHAILRTVYPRDGAQRSSIVLPDRSVQVDQARVCGTDGDSVIVELLNGFCQGSYDPARDLPFHFGLITCAENRRVLVLTLSEIASDPGAQATLVSEVLGSLFSVQADREGARSRGEMSYLEYAAEQRRMYEENGGKAATAQFAARLASRDCGATVRADGCDRLECGKADGPEIAALLRRCVLEGVSPQVVTLTAAAAVDGQWKGVRESCLLVPFSRRRGRAELQRTVGPFEDEHLLQIEWSDTESYRELMWQVRSRLRAAEEQSQHASSAVLRTYGEFRRYVPGARISCALQWTGNNERASERFRAFDENRSVALYGIARRYASNGPANRCNWTLELRPEGRVIRVGWAYHLRGAASEGAALWKEYVRVLGSLIEDPAQPIGN